MTLTDPAADGLAPECVQVRTSAGTTAGRPADQLGEAGSVTGGLRHVSAA